MDSAHGLGPFGHLCWSYQSRTEFTARAFEYMADGLAAHQWVEYVGSGTREQLWAEVASLDGIGGMVDAPGLGVCPVEEFYAFSGGRVVDPVAAAAKRVAETEQALAAGYTGSRVIVDATALASDPQRREAFGRYEYLLDQQMSALPVAALCAYDASEIGAGAAEEIACLHPWANTGATMFRLYADSDVDLALAGEIDLACEELFQATLRHVAEGDTTRELVLDCRALGFISQHGTLALAEFARARGTEIVLQNCPHSAARVIQLLGVTGVRVGQARAGRSSGGTTHDASAQDRMY